MSTVVRYAVLAPERIVDLTSPRYLPEISRAWQGREGWHSERYEPVRDLMERMYIDGFNAASGHYERLEASVKAEGFRNPVMLSAGRLERRDPCEIPPALRGPDLLVSEYLGGSRIWVARRLGLDVPAIVNDHANVLHGARVLPDLASVVERFEDKPRTAQWGPDGVYLNDIPYAHLPAETRYTLAEQSKVRARIIRRIRFAVGQWLGAHD
jgi:hypothetical protein